MKGTDKTMKWMIASDIHGSDLYAEQLLARYHQEGAERLLLLGDILYHGPRNDLPDGYAPKRLIERLNAMKDEIVCVRGNCDALVDQTVLRFPVLDEWRKIEMDGVTVIAIHGHQQQDGGMPDLPPASVLLCGHTHIPECAPLHDGVVRINPGSVSIPKEGSARGYIVAQNGVFTWKDLQGTVLRVYEHG